MFRPHKIRRAQLFCFFVAILLAASLIYPTLDTAHASANHLGEKVDKTSGSINDRVGLLGTKHETLFDYIKQSSNFFASSLFDTNAESSLAASLKHSQIATANFANSFAPVVMDGNFEPSATANFFAPANYTVGTSPKSIAVGDFNLDGRLDAAVLNTSSTNISILLGNVAGGLSPAPTPTIPVGSTLPTTIVKGDFNGDSVLDLATGNRNNCSIFIGNGNGTFTLRPLVTVTYPNFIVTGDFNNDTHLDLATANRSSNSVTVLLNNGFGNFTPQIASSVGTTPNSMATGNFNADTFLDLVVANEGSNTLTVLYGDNAGGFTTSPLLTINSTVIVNGSSVAAKPLSVVAEDFDRDGKTDLAVGVSASPRSINVLLNDGSGGFGNATTFPVILGVPSSTVIRSLVAGDFNFDGFKDLAAATEGGNKIAIVLGNGAGGFGAASFLETHNPVIASTSPQYITTGDFNADGRTDLISANAAVNNVSVFINSARIPDVSLTKVHNGDFSTGFQGTYTLTVSNTGTGATVGTTTVTDTLPAGLSFVAGDGTNWTCSAAGQDVTCTTSEPIQDGESSSITLTVDIASAAAPSVTNTASVANSGELNNSANNSASDTAAVNTPPVSNDDQITTNEDISANISLVSTDANNDALTYSIASPSNGTLSGTIPNLTYTPNPNFNGADSFTFRTNDGKANSNTAIVNVTVNPVDDAPIATNDIYVVAEDDALEVTAPGILINDTEADGSTLTAQLVTTTPEGTLVLNPNGSFTYTPPANFSGTETFTYTAFDGTLPSNTATVTITYDAVNDSPEAANQSVSTNEDIALAITLVANDVDNTDLTYTVLTNPTKGTLSGTAPNLTYTPNANYFGTDSFTFKASDGNSDSNTATVNITINPVNDAPVALNENYSVNDGDTLTVPATSGVLINDSDLENNPLVAVLVTQPANGSVTLNPDGSFSYTPNINGTDSFTYVANDGNIANNSSNVATVTIAVGGVSNLAITQTDSSDPTIVGGSLTYTLTVTNLGPSPATNVVVSDTLAGNIVFNFATSSQGTCSGTSPITCNLNPIARNATANIAINVTPSGSGTISNAASVTGAELDSNTANNSTSESTSVTIDLCTTANFSTATPLGLPGTPRSIATGDFNADGRPDLVTANQSTNNVSIFLGNNTNGFPTSPINIRVGDISSSSIPKAVLIADFNRDNNPDIATANSNQNNISIIFGDGLGGFSAATNYSVAPATKPTGLVAGYFNADNYLDLATANDGSGNVSVLLNNGAGGFPTATNTTASSILRADAIATGDFTSDGNLDLAVTSDRSPGKLFVLQGDGAGNFSTTLGIFNVGNAPSAVIAGDFNGDNKTDLVVANSSSSSVSLLLNNGAGGLDLPQSFTSGASPRGLAAGDLNNDGRLDLVIARGGGGTLISTMLNDGAGGFETARDFTAGTNPFAVALGDFSRDGRLDLAVANETGKSISLLINACNSPDLRLTKTHTGDFNVGQDGVYNLSLTNVGTSTTFGSVTVTDTLPTGLTYVSAVGTDWSCSANGQTVTCTLGNAIAANATTNIVLTVAVSAAAAPSVTNTATVANVSDINSGNDTASDLTIVHPVADLSLTKTASATRVAISNNLTYTVVVRNNGPSTANSMVMTDVLPAGMNFVSASSTRGTCSNNNGTVTCNIPNLLNVTTTNTATITIVTTAQTEGVKVNSASVTGAEIDPVTDNNSATNEVTVGAGADVVISQIASPSPVVAGSNITYTIGLTNSGEVSNLVVVTDNLPANLTFVSCASTGGGVCGGTGNNRTVSFDSLADGAAATITIIATVNSNVVANTIVNNTTSVSSGTPDPRPNSNSVTVPVTVNAPAISFAPTVLDFGMQPVGASGAPQSVIITNTGTAPLIFSSVTLTGVKAVHYAIASNTCSGAGVAPGATCAIGVRFAPTSIGSQSAGLQFAHNANGSPQSVNLNGIGTAPVAAAWGSNSSGQLGNNTTTNNTTPVQIVSLGGGVTFDGGGSHSLALKPDGTVWAWGSNSSGQIGDGTGTRRLVPVQVTSLSGVIRIASGSKHSLALKSNGTVWSWGSNGSGQIGDGVNGSTRKSPVQVANLTNVIAISGGADFSLALKSDGTVWAWGLNSSGQLGDGTTTNRKTPVQVQGLTDVRFISGGGTHSLAIKNNGEVWGWGANGSGQLGNGTSTSKVLLPIRATGLPANIVAVASGGTHSVALTGGGDVWAWGGNNYGQLGNGSTVKSLIPIYIVSGRIAIAAGINHTVALRTGRTVTAVGLNSAGQLGNASTTTATQFVEVRNVANIANIGAGDNHSFAAIP